MTALTNNLTVTKFGGSSVAKYAPTIKQITEATDAKRQFIVVSAPGKITDSDRKLTDLLIEIVETNMPSQPASDLILEKITALNIPFDVAATTAAVTDYLATAQTLPPDFYRAHLVSLGEHLSGKIFADYLGVTYLDPKELFILDTTEGHSNARLDFEKTATHFATIKDTLTAEQYVIPGFYGAGYDGHTALFSRGGSDLTGAYLAFFMNAARYENFTDSPILAADPRIINDPKQIEAVTFKELRDLTYSGFSILHHDVVRPLAEQSIPIEIKSTKDFPEPGTLVLTERTPAETILGVAFANGFVPINLYKPGLHEQPYALSDTLYRLRQLSIPVEHVSTGIDDISLVIKKDYVTGESLITIKKSLTEHFGSKLEITAAAGHDFGLLTVVGEGMRGSVGISGRIQKTLADAGVNIHMIDQSMTERNIIYCIESNTAPAAIESIYDRFIANPETEVLRPQSTPH